MENLINLCYGVHSCDDVSVCICQGKNSIRLKLDDMYDAISMLRNFTEDQIDCASVHFSSDGERMSLVWKK